MEFRRRGQIHERRRGGSGWERPQTVTIPSPVEGKREGVETPDATGARCSIPVPQSMDSGVYTVQIRDSRTDVRVSDHATLTVFPSDMPAWEPIGLNALAGILVLNGARSLRKKWLAPRSRPARVPVFRWNTVRLPGPKSPPIASRASEAYRHTWLKPRKQQYRPTGGQANVDYDIPDCD